MPIDVPPQQVEYRVERAVPADLGEFARIAAAARAMSGERRAATPVSAMLPKLDPGAPAVTHDDRAALAGVMKANWRADLSAGVTPIPDSYVGDRIRVAVDFSKAQDAMASGRFDRTQAAALRCRMVALAMDRRAGEYLEGGEKAAAAARRAVPASEIQACRDIAKGAVARPARRFARVEPVSVDPQLRRAAPVRIDPVMRHAAPVRIDPVGTARVSIDPAPSKRTSINPTLLASRGPSR